MISPIRWWLWGVELVADPLPWWCTATPERASPCCSNTAPVRTIVCVLWARLPHVFMACSVLATDCELILHWGKLFYLYDLDLRCTPVPVEDMIITQKYRVYSNVRCPFFGRCTVLRHSSLTESMDHAAMAHWHLWHICSWRCTSPLGLSNKMFLQDCTSFNSQMGEFYCLLN